MGGGYGSSTALFLVFSHPRHICVHPVDSCPLQTAVYSALFKSLRPEISPDTMIHPKFGQDKQQPTTSSSLCFEPSKHDWIYGNRDCSSHKVEKAIEIDQAQHVTFLYTDNDGESNGSSRFAVIKNFKRIHSPSPPFQSRVP
eukprot:scaffold9159_cov121-Cylindrotheca_fusiformis.AAC.4